MHARQQTTVLALLLAAAAAAFLPQPAAAQYTYGQASWYDYINAGYCGFFDNIPQGGFVGAWPYIETGPPGSGQGFWQPGLAGDACGQCVEVSCVPTWVENSLGSIYLDRTDACKDPNIGVVIQITDECRCSNADRELSQRGNFNWCCNVPTPRLGVDRHIDLSKQAFVELVKDGDAGIGIIGLKWRPVSCDRIGVVRLDGSDSGSAAPSGTAQASPVASDNQNSNLEPQQAQQQQASPDNSSPQQQQGDSQPLATPPPSSPPDSQPPSANPPDSQPPSANPPDSQPPSANPPDSQPPASNPPGSQPPASNPPDSQPPSGNPPDSQPPASNPPDSQPPASNPPDSQPPASNPPASNPPPSNPPPSNPPVIDTSFQHANASLSSNATTGNGTTVTLLPEFSQCGGETGDCAQFGGSAACKDTPFAGYACSPGLQCVRQSRYYWQCLHSRRLRSRRFKLA